MDVGSRDEEGEAYETDAEWEASHQWDSSNRVSTGVEAVNLLVHNCLARFGIYIDSHKGDVRMHLQLSSGLRSYGEGQRAYMVIMQRISVRPSRRRQGLASQVLQSISAAANQRGMKLMIQPVISSEMVSLLSKLQAARLPHDESSYVM